GLFVVVLPVNDAGILVARVFLDAVPDRDDRAAGRIHQNTILFLEDVDLLHRSAEGWKDNHIVLGDIGVRLAAVVIAGEEDETHLAQAVVDRGVVDDLVGDEDALVGIAVARLVSHVHGALDAIAEAELLG